MPIEERIVSSMPTAAARRNGAAVARGVRHVRWAQHEARGWLYQGSSCPNRPSRPTEPCRNR